MYFIWKTYVIIWLKGIFSSMENVCFWTSVYSTSNLRSSQSSFRHYEITWSWAEFSTWLPSGFIYTAAFQGHFLMLIVFNWDPPAPVIGWPCILISLPLTLWGFQKGHLTLSVWESTNTAGKSVSKTSTRYF